MALAWNVDRLVAVDDEYDREYADFRGGSRYETYLKKNQKRFAASQWDDEMDPVRFAIDAWAIATGPILSPGYVRFRPDLFSIALRRDDWDGALYAEIELPLQQHHLTGPRIPYEWRDWETARFQNGVDENFRSLAEPETDGSVTKAILTTTLVRIPGRDWALVTPTALEGPTFYEEARRALALVADHLNREAAPIITSLRAG
ncbi:hypothetical protein EV284_6435 [Streptomyces sp. BK022]|uniref:hypothetical protein n=1 Tax=Streptomyces sp. BK022 TaxID=2512123 RepID=UPI001028C1F6|nr:hypothetical protein [Streptomyces sp. BK022]RZU28269.1 hypothetical protein EV284_6435 [Streptomyces sp. BK022]